MRSSATATGSNRPSRSWRSRSGLNTHHGRYLNRTAVPPPGAMSIARLSWLVTVRCSMATGVGLIGRSRAPGVR